MQYGIYSSSSLLAHAENIGLDAYKVLGYLIEKADPDTGIAIVSARELVRLNASQNPNITHRALKRLFDKGLAREVSKPVTVGKHPTYRTRFKTRLSVRELQVTIPCNVLCTADNHCPNPTWRAVLEHEGLTDANLELILGELSGPVAEQYRLMLFEQAPTAASKGFVSAFYTTAELEGEHAYLSELEAKGYVRLVEHSDPDLFGVLPTPAQAFARLMRR